MAKPRQLKLKVFQAQFGFFDSVVAASGQSAALRAWGTHQNLFASGDAQLATDEDAVATALKHPETPLRRAVGSKDRFALEAASLPQVPDAPKRDPFKAVLKTKAEPTRKPAADRSALDRAEKTLHILEDARKREETKYERLQAELDQERVQAQNDYVSSRKAATADVVDARKAYRDAGGKD